MSFIRSTKDFAGPLDQFFGGEQDPRARPLTLGVPHMGSIGFRATGLSSAKDS